MAGYATAYAWDRILAWLFGRGEPPPDTWFVGLSRVTASQYGNFGEPHPESSYSRKPFPNGTGMWLPLRLQDHDEYTAVQNRAAIEWTLDVDRLDLWLPLVGWSLHDPEGRTWFAGDFPFPVDETTYDGSLIRLRPGDIYVAGVWLGSGVAYWEAV